MIDIKTYTTPCKSRSGNYSEGTTVVQGSTTVVSGGGSSVDIVKELDTITLTDANVLSSKRVLKEISDRGHTHTNKAVLDNLTQAVIDNSHTHANKATLDVIDQSLSTASSVQFAKVTSNDAELGTIKATTADFSGTIKAAAATVIGLVTCATLNADAATIPTINSTNINASTQVVSPLFVGHLQGNADTATRFKDTFKLWGQDFYGNNVSGAISGATTIDASGKVSVGSFVDNGTAAVAGLLSANGGTNTTILNTSDKATLGSLEVIGIAYIDSSIGTSSYISQSSGWRVTPQGNADFRTIYTDELHATAFTADVSQALAGSDYLTKSVSKLSVNFVVPAVGSSVRIIVDDLEGLPATQCFENSDYIRFRAFNRTSGLTISDVWGTVQLDTTYGTNGFSNGTQAYIYTVTSAAVTGLTVYKGSEVLDYGKSSDGLIVRTTLDKNNSPYSQIATWVNDPSNSANYTVHARLGKLSGIAHCSGYGLYTDNAFLTNSILVGDLTKANNYLSYNPAEGLVVKGNLYVSSGESVSGRLSDLQLTADGVKSTVSTYVGATGENLISTINQQAGSVQIQASKINLQGAVTISSMSSDALNTIQGYSTTAANNVQVGGRNLLTDSKGVFIGTSGYYWGFSKSWDVTSLVTIGNTYTLSAKGRIGNSEICALFIRFQAGDRIEDRTISYTEPSYVKKSIIVTIPSWATAIEIYMININSASEGNIKEVKLELGNKPTDWTPAPEDVDSSISTAQQAAQTYATTNCVQVGLSNAPDAIKNQVLAAAHGNFSYIDGSSIYTGTLNANQVTAGYISADRIAASSITAEKINVTDLTANSAFISNLKTNIVNAAYVNTLTLDAAAIKAGTIDTARMNASDIVTKGLQAKTIDAMNATIQNITVTNATISGTLNGCTGIFSGNLSGVKGTIGGWTIQDGGLYNSVSGTGFIKLEVNGGRQLSINSSADSPVLAIRSDSKPALSIYTQDNGGAGIDITAQTTSWAVISHGKVQLVSRNTEGTFINMLCKCQVVVTSSGTIGSTICWVDPVDNLQFMPNRILCINTSDITIYLPDTANIKDGYEIEFRKLWSNNVTIRSYNGLANIILNNAWYDNKTNQRTLDGAYIARYTWCASRAFWVEEYHL